MKAKRLKSLSVLIVTLMMIFNATGINNVFASSAVTSHVKHDNWWMADPSTGRRDNGDTEAELFIGGQQAFCIDAFENFKSGVTMYTVNFEEVGISREIASDCSLIAYFGTKVSGRTGKDWYAITQGLIWKTIHEAQGHTDMCYVETPTNPNYATTVKLWNEILNDVANYKKRPSFANKTYEVNADSTITLTDDNNALKNMKVIKDGGLDVIVNGNQLIVQASQDSADSATIVLQRDIKAEDIGTSLAYYNGKNQSVGVFKVGDPLTVNIKVKVNKFGKLELIKYNEDKSGTVSNTTYRITGPNGFNQIHTTDSHGKIQLDKLPIGEYKAVETQAGTGYLIDTTEFGFTIKPNETTFVNPTNIEPKGKIELNKQIDTTNTNGLTGDAYLKDITFGLYAKEKIVNKANTKTFYEKDGLVSQAKTNSDGKIMWDDLPLGNYYIKELESNDSLVLNTQTIDVTLEYQGQTVKKVIVSKNVINRVNMQKIQVFKSGEKDGISGVVKGLQGAEFTFKLKSEVDHVGWDNAISYAVITTDTNGTARTSYLPHGQYLVKETKTPEGYLTAPDFLISVTDDYSEYKEIEQIKNIHVNNRPFASQVKLIKVDKDSGKNITLNSASFKIKDSKGNYVTQKVGGKKYDTFTTNSKNQITVLFGNKGEVTLPLQLEAGKYTIEEVKTPEGFLSLEKPIQFTITNQYDKDEDNEPILMVKIQNEQPKGKIILKKTDKETEKPLAGVEYELTAKKDIISAIDGSILFKKGSIVVKGITNANGQISIDNLFMGHYELKEVLTNEGYVLSEEVHDVVFEQKDLKTKEYIINIDVTNIAPKGEIHLVKTDKDTKELLSGVIYQLTAKEDIYSLDGRNTLIYKAGDTVSVDASEDGRYMTNELGEIHIANLPLGQYLIKEVKVLDGYVTDKEEYVIDLSYDGSDKTIYTHTLNLTNSKTSVEISKKDISTSHELAGAKLTLYDKDNNVVETWISTDESHMIRGLSVGEMYRLHEDLAPLGYIRANDIEFTINDSEEVKKIEMLDDITKVEISKKDITNGKELSGAQLTLFDKDNNVIETWISTDKPHMIQGLSVGETYRLHEDLAPLGFVKASDIEFTVQDSGEVQKIEMVDDITRVEISKQDITNGKELSGAKLQIIDSQNKIIHEWISTDKPELFEKLPAGEYILREISAPRGYEIAEDVKFTVSETSEIQKVVMKDALTPKAEVLKTGDYTSIGAWLLMIGTAVCVLGYIKSKKEEDDDKVK